MKSNFTQLFLFQILSPIQVKKGRKGKEKEGEKKRQDLFTFPTELSCGRDSTWWLAWNLSQQISAMAKISFHLNLTHSSDASPSGQS